MPVSKQKKAKKPKIDDQTVKAVQLHKKPSQEPRIAAISRKAKSTRLAGHSKDTDIRKQPEKEQTQTEQDIIPLSISKPASVTVNGSGKSKRSEKSSSKPKRSTSLEPPKEDSDHEEAGDGKLDRAATLLAGFESTSDEEEQEDEADGVALDKLPEAPLTTQDKEQLQAAKKRKRDEPGTVYVG